MAQVSLQPLLPPQSDDYWLNLRHFSTEFDADLKLLLTFQLDFVVDESGLLLEWLEDTPMMHLLYKP